MITILIWFDLIFIVLEISFTWFVGPKAPQVNVVTYKALKVSHWLFTNMYNFVGLAVAGAGAGTNGGLCSIVVISDHLSHEAGDVLIEY